MVADESRGAPGASLRDGIFLMIFQAVAIVITTLLTYRSQVFLIIADLLLCEILAAEPHEPTKDYADAESKFGCDLAE